MSDVIIHNHYYGDAEKSADIESGAASVTVIKSEAEQQYTLGLAYPALRADVAVAADGHRDFAGPEALEKTAWAYMTTHRDVSLFHKSGTDGHATVVESYIYRGPDWHVDDKTVIKSGDWMLGTVWDDHGWALIKAGLVKGWSPEGGAKRSKASAERLSELRSQ